MSDNIGVNVEAVDKESLETVRAVIIEILHSPAENETKREALRALMKFGRADNVTISSNHISLSPGE